MTIKEILNERGNNYGEFKEHAQITQGIKNAIKAGVSWSICTDSQREALEMVAHKIGRIVNGDPNYEDSWVDLIGYTQLALEDIQEVKKNIK